MTTLCGYCTRCGGDCFDGVRHRCRPARLLAAEIIGLKMALAKCAARLRAKPLWPPAMIPLYADLLGSIGDLEAALARLEAPRR